MFAKRAAVALALLMLAACSKGTAHHAAAPTTTVVSRSKTVTTQAPPGVQIADLTWISETHGWALAISPGCEYNGCPSVLTTTDGGDTWTRVDKPNSLHNVTRVRFANASFGYAFDPDFATTTDGGATWIAQPGREVAALETDGRTVIRLSYDHDGCPGPCDLTIERSDVGSGDWRGTSRPNPASQAVGAQLVRQGRDDAYIAFLGNPAGGGEGAQSDLQASHDGGRTWVSHADPCWPGQRGEEIDTRAIAAAPGGVVAALCVPRIVQNPAATVIVSTDGGKTFGPKHAAVSALLGEVAVARASDIFVATPGITGAGPVGYSIYASHDGGSTWRRVASDSTLAQNLIVADRAVLGFESAKVGRWIGDPSTVWTTTDGGDHWRPHRFS